MSAADVADPALYRADLGATLLRVTVDLERRAAYLYLPALGERVEMAAAVALVAKLDPSVRHIQVIRGDARAVAFLLRADRWVEGGL